VIVHDAEVLMKAIAESGTHLKKHLVLLGASVPGREQLHLRRRDAIRHDVEESPRRHLDHRHLPNE
jgi:hypothetical protein